MPSNEMIPVESIEDLWEYHEWLPSDDSSLGGMLTTARAALAVKIAEFKGYDFTRAWAALRPIVERVEEGISTQIAGVHIGHCTLTIEWSKKIEGQEYAFSIASSIIGSMVDVLCYLDADEVEWIEGTEEEVEAERRRLFFETHFIDETHLAPVYEDYLDDIACRIFDFFLLSEPPTWRVSKPDEEDED